MQLNTYVNFNGNCAAAFRFYDKHLDANITEMAYYKDMPGASDNSPFASQDDAVLHARAIIGGTELFASDSPADKYAPMGSTFLSLTFDTSEEVDRLYPILSAGGKIIMPLEETFFAHRFAMFTDQFGVNWMIIHEKKMP